jgi:hypothetical protein
VNKWEEIAKDLLPLAHQVLLVSSTLLTKKSVCLRLCRVQCSHVHRSSVHRQGHCAIWRPNVQCVLLCKQVETIRNRIKLLALCTCTHSRLDVRVCKKDHSFLWSTLKRLARTTLCSSNTTSDFWGTTKSSDLSHLYFSNHHTDQINGAESSIFARPKEQFQLNLQ